jgi:hypothetical protein
MDERIRGAVYIPARAFNAYQMWRDYDHEVALRDLGFAKSLGLNALRFWSSYERWLENRDALGKSLKLFFDAAERLGIRLLVSGFEGCGVEPTPEHLADRDPWTAFCIASPGEAVIGGGSWSGPLGYLAWLLETVGRHPALLALEPMNEPHHTVAHTRFVRSLFREARRLEAPCRLSHGALGGVLWNTVVLDLGVEVLQAHENFPRSVKDFEIELGKAELLAEGLEKDVYITEWQRVRAGGSGWEWDARLGPGEWAPDLASLAPSMERHPRLGSFFWSLMVKPAYLPPQRRKGTLNGVFHEDGSVYSLEDARAVSALPSFSARERREWPEWAAAVPEKAGLRGP